MHERKYNEKVHPINASYYEKEYENDFDKWAEIEGQTEFDTFINMLEKKVNYEFLVSKFVSHVPQDGMNGRNKIIIILSDGSTYAFKFIYKYELSTIFTYGPEEAARMYFNSIVKGIDSGEAAILK